MQRASLVIGIVFLLFGGSHPALSTETAKSFELVAVYSKIQGIGMKYMTGASFTTIADCEAALTSVQHVVTNIQVQGIFVLHTSWALTHHITDLPMMENPQTVPAYPFMDNY